LRTASCLITFICWWKAWRQTPTAVGSFDWQNNTPGMGIRRRLAVDFGSGMDMNTLCAALKQAGRSLGTFWRIPFVPGW